jgi:signal transduction histidine kinase
VGNWVPAFSRDSIYLYMLVMIRKLFFLGFFLLMFLVSCDSKTTPVVSDSRNDSIKKYLELGGNIKLSSDLRNKYNDKAFSLIDLSRNDTLIRNYLATLSYNYMNLNNGKSINKVGKIHYKKSISASDTLNLARHYRYKAGYFKRTFVNDSALYYYLKAEKFYKNTNDELGLAIVYNNKRQIQYMFDDYYGSNLSSKKAYRYFKNNNNVNGQYNSLIAIGNNSVIIKEYKTAIKAFQEALQIVKKDSLIDEPGTCLNNLGNAYKEQKQFKKAMYYLNLALEDKDMIKTDPTLRGFILNNLSYCKLQLKDYSDLPAMLFEAKKIMIDNEGVKESAITNIYLSNYFIAIKDTLKSQFYAEEALKIAKNYGAPYYYLSALSNAGSVNGKKASKYIVEYSRIHDSLYFVENNTRNQYYTIQFETDNIRQEKEKAIFQKWIITVISSVIILVIILLLVITKQRAKHKELGLIQQQQKDNEKIYDLMLVQKSKEEQAKQSEKKRIALELHDGVMNRLASTRLNLSILSYKKDDETIGKCLSYVNGLYEIEQEIRYITHDLNLEIFKSDNGFTPLLIDLISIQNDTTNTNYQLEIDESINWINVHISIKMNLYRIIQEASHNINKFAQANNVIVSFILDERNLCLSITDDGKGFTVEKNTEGIGLKNIRHRVNNLRGKFVIQSKNGCTSLNIAIPVS